MFGMRQLLKHTKHVKQARTSKLKWRIVTNLMALALLNK